MDLSRCQFVLKCQSECWLEIFLAHNGLGFRNSFSYQIYVDNCRYIFTFAIGAGPVTGIIIPELSSARTRSKVMGFSFTVHWVCTFQPQKTTFVVACMQIKQHSYLIQNMVFNGISLWITLFSDMQFFGGAIFS